MPSFTPNLNLIKPFGNENFSVAHVNGNADKVDLSFGELNSKIDKNELLLDDLGYDIRKLGLPLDGSVDLSSQIKQALTTYKNVVIPANATVGLSQTLVLNRGESLIGLSENSRGYGKTAKIKWIGATDNKKTVIQIGSNAVGEEPIVDASDIVLMNVSIDADNKAGFGVYGTYVTNESLIRNVVTHNTLEYGMFFAKCWYANYERLLAMNSRGNGISFGMPLEYLDGTSVTWTSAANLEINNCAIRRVRAYQCGRYFSVENPNTFDPQNVAMRRKGYGLGFGVGNSFNAADFTSERNGGVGLYVYTGFQPIKHISNGYIENNCMNSGLDPASNMACIILESLNPSGGSYTLENLFCNYNFGGIFHTGVFGRKIWLRNVHQPRFLKSLDGVSDNSLWSEVLKDNVYYGCGYYNTLSSLCPSSNVVQTVNSKEAFTIPVTYWEGFRLVYIKIEDGVQPHGSLIVRNKDGTTAARSYPSNLTNAYTYAFALNENVVSVEKAGATSSTDAQITVKILNAKYTNQ